jgi:hypothetical protein
MYVYSTRIVVQLKKGRTNIMFIKYNNNNIKCTHLQSKKWIKKSLKRARLTVSFSLYPLLQQQPNVVLLNLPFPADPQPSIDTVPIGPPGYSWRLVPPPEASVAIREALVDSFP